MNDDYKMAAAARDRLWCRAACNALDPAEIEQLMRTFNGLRMEQERLYAVAADGTDSEPAVKAGSFNRQDSGPAARA